MKITLATESFYHKFANSGDVIQMKRLYSGLKEIGVDVKLNMIIGDAIDCKEIETCKDMCLGCGKINAVDFLDRYISNLPDADIYHIRGNTLNIKMKDKKKVLIAVPASILGEGDANFDRYSFGKANSLVCLNKHFTRLCSDKFPEFEFETLPICVDLNTFKPDVPLHPIFEDIKTNNVIGYIGGYHDYQGIEELIKFLPVIRRHVPDAHLALAINKFPANRSKNELFQLIKVLGLSKNITITTISNSEMPMFLKGCKVMHLIRKPFNIPLIPIKLLDIMAMEKPFIYSKGDVGVECLWKDERFSVGANANEFLSKYISILKSDVKMNGFRKLIEFNKMSQTQAAQSAAEIYKSLEGDGR